VSVHGLGVVLDSFGQPIKDALRSAADLELRQVELPATTREVDPIELGRSGRRHLLHYVSGLGLNLAALGGDLGGARFTDSSALDQRLEKTRRIIEMAAELRVPVVTTHLGRVDAETLKKDTCWRPSGIWPKSRTGLERSWPSKPARATRRRWPACCGR
jgi:sugar phosphate isomerase/epimerase